MRRPLLGVGTRFSNVMRFSGAASTLQPWRTHGGGGDEDATPADPGGGGAVGAEGTINWPGLS